MKKLVAFTDVCSSSVIVEGLSERSRIPEWKEHLNKILHGIRQRQSDLNFEIYKFLGDGWVLLFEPGVSNKLEIMNFFRNLCEIHRTNFEDNISDYMDGVIPNIGLSFGLYFGNIYPVEINEQQEYVGESLNIASRFQGSIRNQKDTSDHAANQLLMSWPDYISYFKDQIDAEYSEYTKKVERKLRNIKNNKTWNCARIHLLQ